MSGNFERAPETHGQCTSRPAGGRSFSIRFVCQQGSLEIQSLLLAASLKKFLRVPHELIACIPTPESVWGPVSSTTLDHFEKLGVSVNPIENPLGKGHPHANKFQCLDLPTHLDKIVFLDSDIICMRELDDSPRFASQAALKPADAIRVVFSEDQWRKIYAAAGHELPAWRVETTVSQQVSPPWFNSGVMFVDRDVPLGTTWFDVAMELNRHPELPQEKDTWSDQVSLAVALHRLGVKIESLDEDYNYPAQYRRVRQENQPVLCHYHWPRVIRREAHLSDFIKEILAENPKLLRMVKADPHWRTIFQEHKVPPKVYWLSNKVETDGQDVIITGIPRSGTSYLCKLLHKFDNCVALNEPSELVHRLANFPWTVEAYLADTRQKILDGELIENKLKDGEVVEDTAVDIENVLYAPSVRFANFVLAVKNNRPVLNRLNLLTRYLSPEVRFVACVRNPLDSIASWISSFPQLRDVDFSQVKVGGPGDRFLDSETRDEVEKICSLSDPAEKRARLWNLLAIKILTHRHRLLLVRYDSLISEPLATLQRILAGCDTGYRREEINPSSPRSRREQLSEHDWEVVFDLCAENARALDVSIDHLYTSRPWRKAIIPVR